ncbi:UNVERIFIED_CONTAM: hypothetical protein GTU68_001855, partial [Idotea baltica]|nr:hypothetical protein [Idotea baltica]
FWHYRASVRKSHCLTWTFDGHWGQSLFAGDSQRTAPTPLAKVVRNIRKSVLCSVLSILLSYNVNGSRNVELHLILCKKNRNWGIRKLAEAALASVGLGDRMDHKPNELSGGQQQRVAIARALVNQPSIILADEPTGNLDSQSSEEILQIFSELNKEGKTIIMITHEPEIAKKAKRIIRISDGKVVSDQPSSTVEA